MIIKFYLLENVINPNIKLHTTREHILKKFSKKFFSNLNTVYIRDIKTHFDIKTGNFTEYTEYPQFIQEKYNETHTNIFYCWNDSEALEKFNDNNLKIDKIDIMKYNFYRFIDENGQKIIQISKQCILDKLKQEKSTEKILEINKIKEYFNIYFDSIVLECFNEIQPVKTFKDKDVINLDDYEYYMIMTTAI